MIFSDEVITSRHNPMITYVSSLQDKKMREEKHTFIAEGEKLFTEAVLSSLEIQCVFILQNKCAHFKEFIKNLTDSSEKYKNIKVYTVAEPCFDKISTEKAPQGIITLIKYLDNYIKYNIIKSKNFAFSGEKLLLLYSMQDPGNLGAVIRSAVAFGVDRIITTNDSADAFSPKTVRGAMGTLFRISVCTVSDMKSAVLALKENNRRVFSAELTDNAISLDEISLKQSDVILIGNEGHGIPSDISSVCDRSIYIPISSGAESLNASVAASIFLWQQRK